MPIFILPSDLSSQISAGEVIERPASVVKEIIENSIDAGSKNIDIIIEKSGFQSILLQDDGCGIDKKDLSLAIAHHATSKIRKLSDLDTISTFGFRGEALASIRAVSRLTLISCTQSSNDIAWKIYSEGLMNNDISLQPIAHPLGTTIIVENLFYNIPIRLKFIKNKKMEFLKILEVIKKIALSHFYINFTLKHNQKLIIKFNSINDKKNKINRLKDVLHFIDINRLIEIRESKDSLSLFGWISYPQDFKDSKNVQYCYVNNRYIYNNIFINAVRSAYEDIIGSKYISFILYLTIPSINIDINIHPTKNEIKFNRSNKIYMFIYKAIVCHLRKFKKQYLINTFLLKKISNIYNKKESFNSKTFDADISTLTSLFLFKKNIGSKDKNIVNKKHVNFFLNDYLQTYEHSLIKLLMVIHKYYGLIYYGGNFSLISFPLAKGIIRKKKLKDSIKKKIIPEFFLTDIEINITSQEHIILFNNKEILLKLGFNLIFKKKYVILNSIPFFLKKQNINLIISQFFTFLFIKKKILISEIVNWFYTNVFIELNSWNYINGISVLLEIEHYYPLLLVNPPPKLLQKINIDAALCILKI